MYKKSLCSTVLLEKIFYLNKMLNSVDLYFEVDLPKVFLADHPIGSIIGRAKIGNNFFFNQNCTVGSNKDVFPVLSENVIMMPGSTIIGKCFIGSYTIISSNSFIKDVDIPNNSMVVGIYPNHRILPLSVENRNTYFGIFSQ